MIVSFADALTEKVFLGETLTRRDIRKLGDLNIDKAQERLVVLSQTAERDLLALTFLHYHKLHGTGRYSIDADSRRSKWRITFAWTGDDHMDVQLVLIEDTH